MAWQPVEGNEPATALAVLRTRADCLAEMYALPAGRFQACLERLVAAFAPELLGDPSALDDALHRFPLSLLGDALASLPADVAVRLIEGEDLGQLARRVQTTEWLAYEDTPSYTLAELARHAEQFRSYLEGHRDFLVETGCAPRTYAVCRWLYVYLARLYPTRRPASPWPADAFGRDRRAGPNYRPYEWVRWPTPAAAAPAGAADPGGGGVLAEDLRLCDFGQASLQPGLRREDAERLDAERGRLFDAKLGVLQLAAAAARGRTAAGLWDGFVRVLADSFTPEEVEFFFAMDRQYLHADARAGRDWEHHPSQVPGGLSNCVEVLGHVEKEIRIGTLAHARASLPDELWQHITAPCRGGWGNRWAYLRVVDSPGQERLDAALRHLWLRQEREQGFWVDFRARVSASLSGEFRVPVSVYVPVGLAAGLQPLLQSHADRVLEPDRSEQTSGRSPADRVTARFPSPEGLRWPEVAMDFVTEDSLRVTARGIARTYTFAELGFKDGRRGDRPDSVWGLLRGLAGHDTASGFGRPAEPRFWQRLRTNVTTIRRRLRALMGVDGDPFPYSRAGDGYRPAFALTRTRLDQNQANAGRDEDDDEVDGV